jgi:diacylglycerol kinase (ATP)
MRIKVIYNPVAGRGRARRHIAEAQECFRANGAEVDCSASVTPADLTRLAAEASRAKYDRVVICGGDGSLNLAVRELDLSSVTLALLPMGSGDDFARVAGIPRDVKAACDVALRGRVREVDVALANGIRYVGVAGLGFDSEVARFANERVGLLRGSAVYLYAILRVLPRFRPHRIRVEYDDTIREEEVMFAVVGNSQQYGGGIRITPQASIDDGLLDLCMIGKTSRMHLLRTLPTAYTGKHLADPIVSTARGTAFHISSERVMDIYADGERITTTPTSFAIAAQKLRIVVP